MSERKSLLDGVFGEVLKLEPGQEDRLQSLLDDVFQTDEGGVESFIDALGDLVTDPMDQELSRVVDGRPDQIKSPDLVEQQSGTIRIKHGWHENDYVWHVSAWHQAKQFKVTLERVAYAVAKTMHTVIPDNVEVKIWFPYQEWDIKEMTFKAIDLRSEWSITDDSIGKLTEHIFKVLNLLT